MISEDLGIVVFTVLTSALSTGLILVPGIALAFALSRWRGVGRDVLETVVSLPLVLPPTAVGLVLLQLLASDGAFGAWLDAIGVRVVFTWKGVVLAQAVMSLPLLVRTARTAFDEVDPRLAPLARTLGAPRWKVFFRVTLPLAWRGIAAGTLLAFARALGEFGATILVAGNIPGRTQTLSLAIFQRIQLGEDGAALRLAGIITVVAFLAVFLTERVRPRVTGGRTG